VVTATLSIIEELYLKIPPDVSAGEIPDKITVIIYFPLSTSAAHCAIGFRVRGKDFHTDPNVPHLSKDI